MLNLLLHLRRLYWFIFRPMTRGVRAILVSPTGEVLLVRHSYGEGWYLPGGRTRSREDDVVALQRELREELGVEIQGSVKKLGEYTNSQEYKRDTIIVFVVESFTRSHAKDAEIDDVGFFAPDSLPSDASPGTRRRIEEWMDKRPIGNQW